MNAPAVLVISCSLNAYSRSRILAQSTVELLQNLGAKAELIDMRDHELPLCDGGGTSNDAAGALQSKIAAADAILLAAPVYNYDLNAVAKNLIESTGSAWEGKPVGFICAAGGRSSYMSPMGLANSLMLDFRCWIIPRFVYSTNADFENDQPSEAIRARVEQLAGAAIGIAQGLEHTRRVAA